MDTEFSASGRGFRVSPFLYEGRTRYIFQNAVTLEPSIAVSFYEQHRAEKRGSHNTVRHDLNMLVHLFTWAWRESPEAVPVTPQSPL